MNKFETSRDKFIFFIFLSFLLHFLLFSFYYISDNTIDTPLFEIIELSQNNNEDKPGSIENKSGKLNKNLKNINEKNPKRAKNYTSDTNNITFTTKNIIPNDMEEIQGPSLPRRQTVSAETKDPIYADYVEEWRRRVEIIGNLYYPEEVALKNISGDLLLDAAIDKEGNLKGVRILRTSGNSVLDGAAINIVKLAAPFSPLPEKVIEDTDILHITRTWKFTNEKQDK